MSVEFRPDSHAEDLEDTLELPVPDFASSGPAPTLEQTIIMRGFAAPESPLQTDTHPILSLPEAAGELAQDLREAQERLARRDDRLAVAELALDAARASEQALRESHGQELAAVRDAAQQELQQVSEHSRRELEQAREALRQATQAGASQAGIVQDLTDQLAQANARADALALHVAQLRAELDANRAQALAARQRLSAQGADQGELVRQLAELRAVSERQLEALRSVEGYRAISDAQLDARERHIVELETQLALMQAAEERREAERAALAQQLNQVAEGTARQQQDLASLGATRTDLLNKVTVLEEELLAVQARAAADLASRERQHSEALADHQDALQRLQAERTALSEHVVEREQDLRAAEEQIGRVESEIAHRASRVEELTRGNELLSQRLADARREQAARDDRIRALEAQAQQHATILANLHQNIQRLGREAVAPPAHVVVEVSLEDTVRELVLDLDGVVRAFPLGRRTTVGRTADNDISLDTGFISRHHAVLLTSSKHTILEDLNSTNGVRVNGQRITRQVIKDGDTVTIGKTDFRYQVRHGAGAAEAGLP